MHSSEENIKSVLSNELSLLDEQGLLRNLKRFSNNRGVHAELNGKKITLFCGNDYLGFSQHPKVKQAARGTIEEYGVGSGAARLISGNTPVHEELEKKLAKIKHQETALLFSTGYMANVGVLSALAEKEDVIILDKLSHASLIDGARLSGAQMRVFPHKNYDRCEEILKNSSNKRRKIIATDSIFSMDGDCADVKALSKLKKKYNALLIVDDAHGTGVLGKKGFGITEIVDPQSIDIVVGTLSKGLGCLGGFAAGSREVINFLLNSARSFLFATSLPASVCQAALESISVLESEPKWLKQLWENTEEVVSLLKNKGIELSRPSSPILPIPVGDEKKTVELSNQLLEQGIYIPAIRYPTVARGKARLRMTVSALHQFSDIAELVRCFVSIYK